jgi:hypothetical protein
VDTDSEDELKDISSDKVGESSDERISSLAMSSAKKCSIKTNPDQQIVLVALSKLSADDLARLKPRLGIDT